MVYEIINQIFKKEPVNSFLYRLVPQLRKCGQLLNFGGKASYFSFILHKIN